MSHKMNCVPLGWCLLVGWSVVCLVTVFAASTAASTLAAAPLDRPALLASPLAVGVEPTEHTRVSPTRPKVTTRTRAATGGDSATDTPGIEPESYTCNQPGYIDFEGLPDHYDLSASAIGGVQFTTTNGYTWEVGDFASREYDGKYPEGDYTSQGTNWAWLGPEEGAGRIDFVNGPASHFSLLTSAGTTVELEAYNASGELLATAGPISPNIDTGTMDELRITRSTPDMAYVIVHDDGNYFLVDSICTDAPGTYTTPIGGEVGNQMAGNPSMNYVQCEYGDYPVNCATGDFWHTFSDISLVGRGLPLAVTRTYNSALASTDGSFGFGWSSDITMSAIKEGEDVTIRQEDGSTDTFTPNGSGGYATPSSVFATLVENPDGSYTFTRRNSDRFVFSSTGQLAEESERDGNTTTFTYNGSGQLDAETDSSGRVVSFAYNPSGRITSVTDPMGRSTTYVYDPAGNLIEVVDPLERHWQFTYDSEHRMITMREPRYYGDTTTSPSPVVTNTYDESGRVSARSDPLGGTTTFNYTSQPGSTVITDPAGKVTVETYANGELVSITKGVGTSNEATWHYTYDPATLGITRVVDPDGDVTDNTYEAAGNLTSTDNPIGDRTSYTYNAFNEITSETDPVGVTTSYEYDSTGNLLSKSSPLVEVSQESRTTYRYEAAPGEVTSVTDPDGHTTMYTYDNVGGRTSATDPDGNTTTYTYDVDGELTAAVAPAGNTAGGDPAAHTTSYAYDLDGELASETDVLGHTTNYSYDANGNRVSVTDANGRTTQQAYNADNELVEVTKPSGSVLKTKWDAVGNMVAQIDGAGHATTYAYDPVDRLISVTDPDGHTTNYRYDLAGRKTAMINAEGETTEYGYNAAGELTSVTYSDGTTPNVTESYDGDGNRTDLTDGSGTSTFAYDSLDRMTSATDGAGATVRYEYDLAGHLTTLTYPNGKSVARTYNAAGSLTSVTDWQGHTTHFSYDADSDLSEEHFPGSVNTQLSYDNTDRLTSIIDTKEASTLASFRYTRDPVGLVTSEIATNGETTTTNYSHNALDELTVVNETPYGYDAADNPTTFGATSQTFDPADELRASTTPGDASEHSNEEPSSGNESPPSTTPPPGPTPSTQTPTTLGSTSTPTGSVQGFHASHTPPPTVDAVVSATSARHGKLTTPALRTHNSDHLIVAFISGATGRRATAISGDRLHWSLLAHANGPGGTTEIWQAHATTRLNGPVTIRLHDGGHPTTATIAAFAGEPHITAHTASHGQGSAPSNSLTSLEGTSLWAVGHSAGQKQAIAPPVGQQLITQRFDKKDHTDGWVQQTSASAAHIADTRTSAHWTLLAVAIGARSAQAARVTKRTRTSTLATAPASSSAGSATGNASAHTTSRAMTDTSGPVTRQFAYNDRGDRIEETTGSSSVKLNYDQADRLIAVGNNITYAYNGDGLRVSKTVERATTEFIWNQAEATPELVQDGSTYYIYGPEGKAIEQINGETSIYLHQDQQNSTRLLTDASGNVVGRYDYDAWGNVRSHTGSATTNLQYDGQYTDAETGFQYLRARYYDPTTGVFLTRDPLASITRSQYSYARNSPLDYIDSSGLLGDPIGALSTLYDNVKSVADTFVVTPIVCIGGGHCKAALNEDAHDWEKSATDYLEGKFLQFPTIPLPTLNLPGLGAPSGPVADLNGLYNYYPSAGLASYMFQPDCGTWQTFSA